MSQLSVEEILYLHYRIIKKTGGAKGIRDLGLLKSALSRPYAGYGHVEAYPTVFDKASVIAHSIISNHPFIDGNKRTGIAAAAIFLRRNDYLLKTTQEEMVRFTLEIAQGKVEWRQISKWLKENSIKARG